MRRRLLLAGSAAAVAAVVAGVVAVVWSPWSSSAAPSRPVALAAGTRSLRLVESGNECAGIGPLCIHRDLPAEAYLVVTSAGDQRTLEWRLSADHLESQTYRVGEGGALALVGQRQDIRFAGIGRDERDHPAPSPPTLYPARLEPGATWRATYDLRRLHAVTAGRVLRREDVVVDGSAIPTVVVELHTTTTGPFHGDEVSTEWWAPSLGLPLRRTITRSLGGEFTYRLTLDLRVASLR